MDKTTESLWLADSSLPNFDSLGADLECDVLIVGAGIAGLSTAYALTKAGVPVIVVDDGPLAGGETERTTAHVTSVLDTRYHQLEKWHGAAMTSQIATSLRHALERIAWTVQEEGIDCGFESKNAYLFLKPGDDQKVLEDEMTAMQNAGFTGVEIVKKAPMPTPNPGPALRIPAQAQFHVLRYLNGLVKAVTSGGGKIFCDTHVTSIKDGDVVDVLTDSGHTIRAKHVVIATNSPISNLVAIHTKQAAYRSYVIACEMDDDTKLDGLFWDTDSPYHYLRTEPIFDKNYIIIGGEDRKTGQDEEYDKHFQRLEEWSRQLMPQLGPVEFKWSGQVLEPVDGLAFIGHDPGHKENIYVATGFSGVGMTQGTLAGMILADQIMGKENVYADIYKPTRKTLATMDTYIKENANVAAQYVDHLKPTELSEADIPAGEGAIVNDGADKLAVYRDEYGQVHRFSAVCPHLKALVRWNPVEKSWDCPAHGSRFEALGGVIDGPANCDLSSCALKIDSDETAPAFQFPKGADDPLPV
ncbi:MAG: FAD-dependent oxidoreductase [Candidatus Melainabacteria bacterium]|nr:FAD-dependent oxidoreductase [Candidatus Melainabacteria bacterium]